MVMLSHAFKGDCKQIILKREITYEIAIRSLVKNILYGAYTPIPESFSSNIRELISEMLTKDPLQRPSIKEILQKDFLAVISISRR